jgi:hypothetical protein
MDLVKRIFTKKDIEPRELIPPSVPSHDRNEVAHFRAYDRELQFRSRALEIEAELLGRRLIREK